MAVDKSIDYEIQGGVKNYRPSKMVKAPVTAKSSPDTPTAHLAYITPEEQDILIDLNLYGSLKGKPNRGPSGIPSLEGDFGGPGGFGGYQGGGGSRSDRDVSGYRDTGSGNYRASRREADVAARKEYEKNRAIREANERAADILAGRDPRLSGGMRAPGSRFGGLGNLIMSGIGALMGIPGLGLITGGFDKLKGGLSNLNETLGDFREKTTGYRTQAEYDAARQQRQLQGRLDNLYDRKSKGKSFSQKNIDMLESMGLQPSTAQNVLTGRDLKGFTESRGLQTPSDPFAMSIGPQPVNVPAREDPVSSYGLQDYGYDYGTAGAAVPTDMLAPTPVENVIQDVYSGAKNIGAKGNSFLDSLYNADLINQLGYQAFKNYPSDSATGPLSDARHMAAMNELSKSLSPFDNKFGNFIGDTAAIALGAINELPDFFRGANPAMLAAGLATNNPVTMRAGLDDKAVAAGMEDLSANYAGTYGTPNTTSAQQIYDQVFNTNRFASTGFAEGGIASLSNRRG